MQIAHLNIVTLPGHFDEFISLMQDNEFDIMSLSETRLDEYDITDNELCIDDYVLYRNDRNRKGGGVAAYVKGGGVWGLKMVNYCCLNENEIVQS